MTSKIKVDNITNQSDSNIVNKCGTTITLGASGDTIALASGASQTGFGRTGTVDWQTGSIKTATFTAANGEGYFANTSGGAFTMNLPAGTAGNIVSVVDYTNTFQTNNLTITPNGSQKIGGIAASFTASTEGQSLTFVYVDDTEGWKNVQDSTSNAIGTIPYIVATGGTIETVCTNYKIHTFTGPGTFTVCNVSNVCASRNVVDYLVVAGGGGGGSINSPLSNNGEAGGGAGGYRESPGTATGSYTVSPLGTSPAAAIPVSTNSFPIVVGAGGSGFAGNPPAATPGAPGKGSDSSFSSITSTGGGGASSGPAGAAGAAGGSGGGINLNSIPGGAGNTPPVSPPQGNPGGPAGPNTSTGSGGGGALVAGTARSGPPSGSPGGDGATTSITGSPVSYAGGGGGGGYNNSTTYPGGVGGGGNSGTNSTTNATDLDGTNGKGGGGGGGSSGAPSNLRGGNGGSGIVVIRYKFQ